MSGLKSAEFRRERETTWRRLEDLVGEVERKGADAVSGEDLVRLPVLYRAGLSSLGVARAISLDRALLEYLESLCQRAYFCVYAARRAEPGAVSRFFARGFPAAVRRLRGPILLAAAFLLAGVVAGHVLVSRDLDRYYSFVDPAIAQGRDPATSTEDLLAGLRRRATAEESLEVFASFLFTHNAQIGLMCFALGFVAGLPVFFLLFTNGLLLGAFGALFASRGLEGEFWGWVLPHGVTELLALVLCGGAGLALAQALVFPGYLSRTRALAENGRTAGVVVLGTLGLFLVAGLIEGFFRQWVTDTTVRYALAASTTAFWAAYFGAAGRTPGGA